MLSSETPECKNLLTSTLVGNSRPDIKRHLQNNVEWAGQPINETATKFFENSLEGGKKKLKSTILSLQFVTLKATPRPL